MDWNVKKTVDFSCKLRFVEFNKHYKCQDYLFVFPT